MSPRWLIAVVCIFLALTPTSVTPQAMVVLKVLKTALCTVCSGTFIIASCASRERLMCRVIAFKLKLLCRTYPVAYGLIHILLACTNYGAPSQRKCATPPFGCAPWNIRILGLCQPLKVCCIKGGSVGSDPKSNFVLPEVLKQSITSKHRRTSGRPATVTMSGNGMESENFRASVGRSHSSNQTSRFYIPSTPQEYMEDWPENEDNPRIVEQAIRKQYDKLLLELHAINREEAENGGEAVQIPSFKEFSSVALGDTPIQ